MGVMTDVVTQTESYADAVKRLDTALREMEDEVEKVRRGYLPEVVELSKRAAEEKALLVSVINENPELFEKPRTMTISGIKIGFRKQKGSIEIADEDNTIRLIKDKLPERSDTLIKVTEKVVKKAAENLTAVELKAVGIEVTADTDEVVVAVVDDVISKLVEKTIEEYYAMQFEEV